jgi:hypothetical protein
MRRPLTALSRLALWCSPLVLAAGCDKAGPVPDLDLDMDGFSWSEDCDDLDAAIRPGAGEICDRIDNNCDGYIDEAGALDAVTWYGDLDGDLYGDEAYTRVLCNAPQGFVNVAGDCDDTSPQVNPEGEESCNELDDDCNGTVDDNASDTEQYYIDADGDNFGDAADTTPVAACSQPVGYSPNAEDCDDADPGINPLATEVWYDGVDQDCEGGSDYDADADGDRAIAFGGTDCDDTRPYVRPGREEKCDGVDNDCDGSIDPDTSTGTTVYYHDADDDGYGALGDTLRACDPPSGYTTADLATDCDDTNRNIFPGGTEVWYDGVDGDCNGASDFDADLDGFDAELYGGDDCDDTNAATFPTTWYEDADLDGHGDLTVMVSACASPGADWSLLADDCDPTNDTVHPGATEICGDGVDNNCDDSANACGLLGTINAFSSVASFFGESTTDAAGNAMANVGDVNGDGLDDLLIGVEANDTAGTNGGRAYLLYGPVSGTGSLAGADALITPLAGAGKFGTQVSALGDLDGDGFTTFAVGALSADGDAGSSGAVYLFEGPLAASLDTTAATTVLGGSTTTSRFGEALSGGLDLSGDDVLDLLIASSRSSEVASNSGRAYLFSGELPASVSTTDALMTVSGVAARDYVGSDVVASEDVDGDGLGDLVIGAKGYDSYGAVGLFLGGAPGDYALPDADLLIAGDSRNIIGSYLGSAGDLDGDGLADLLIGDPYNDTNGTSSGVLYLASGTNTGSLSLAAAAHATLLGTAAGDAAGYAMTGLSDVDGNGQVDLVVGASGASTQPDPVTGASFSAGVTYVVVGPLTGGTLSLALDADGFIEGRNNLDRFGQGVAAGGDLNADGFDDLLIGAPNSENPASASNVGRVFLFLGGEGY